MTLDVLISGKVQGVGFRNFVKYHARKMGLNGFVRNTRDGKVEATFSGNEEKIRKILEICRKGPFIAQVDSVIHEFKKDSKQFTSFDIIR